MEKNMPFICLYMSYLDILEPFTDAQRGRILMAMLRYVALGEMPVFKGGERYLWPSMQSQLDRDMEAYLLRCEKNKRNGKKGGRPSQNPEKPKKPKEHEMENEKEEALKKASFSFVRPSLEEVAAYCREQGLGTDAGRFVDYYTANGWKMGSSPMEDWKAAVRAWDRKEQEYGKNRNGHGTVDPEYRTSFGTSV